MTREGWRAAVIEAMDRHEAGDSRFLNLIADLLTDEDAVERQIREQDQEMKSLLQIEIQRRVYGPKAWES